MKTIEIAILWAVFHEMLGVWLWIGLCLTLLGLGIFIRLIKSEQKWVYRRLLVSQAWGLLGGFISLIGIVWLSSSGFTDAGGPIDWLLIASIYMMGWLSSSIWAYNLIAIGPKIKSKLLKK